MIVNPTILLFADAGAKDACNHGNFLGLVPWYHYLSPDNFGTGKQACDIINFNVAPTSGSSDIPLVLLAVVDDLLRIAGVVAVAFVIVGAFRYVASQGNPEDTAKAQSTIINALIGMVVAIIAVGIVSFIGSKLGG